MKITEYNQFERSARQGPRVTRKIRSDNPLDIQLAKAKLRTVLSEVYARAGVPPESIEHTLARLDDLNLGPEQVLVGYSSIEGAQAGLESSPLFQPPAEEKADRPILLDGR